MSNPNTQLAAKNDFKSLVQSDAFKSQVAAALPKHITAERFARVTLTAMMKTPKLLDCSKESVFKAIFDCASMGLEPDGRRAHLIPYGSTCQLILDYKGLVELALRSGTIASIHADTVHESDVFEVDRGRLTKHSIDYKKARGKAYAAYCLITMKDGAEKLEVMTEDEINKIKNRSRASGSGPWVTDTLEMWKKTVARRAFKWVPLSPEIREKIESDDELPPVNVTPKVSMTELLAGATDEVPATEVPVAEEVKP
jgi:recombination protein RecT